MRLHHVLLALAVCATITRPAAADTNVSGSISTNTTWTTTGSPYIVVGNLTVDTGKTLTIDPGVTVKFNTNIYLAISGTLNANGTSTNPVTLTANGTTTTAFWQRVHYRSGGAGTLTYTNILYSGQWGYPAVTIENASPTLDHVTISYSDRDGISVEGTTAAPTLTNSTISNNVRYGVNVFSPNTITISNTAFTDNQNYAINTDGDAKLVDLANITATGNGGGALNAIARRGNGITASQRWPASALPWVLTNGTHIAAGATLTIDPAATIKIESNQTFSIQGTLTAVGTSTNPITFTTNAATPAPGGWNRIWFRPGSSGTISYAAIEYGGYSGYPNVHIESSSPTFSNVTVANSANDGIRVEGSGAAPTITASAINSNAGYGINLRNPNAFTVSNVSFTNNGNYAIATDGNTTLDVTTLTATGNGAGTKNAIAHRSNATIAGNERWRNAGLPWVVTSSTDVGPTGTLTIDPGVTVKVENNQALMIAGNLTANGTVALPITFTTNAATPTAGLWQSLYFKPGSTGTIAYATVAYSGWGGWGSFRIESASPIVDHVTVTNSGSRSVLVTGNGAPRFRHCAFVNPPAKAIENQGTGQVDAVLNYWGTTDGPAGPPAKGTGASVSWNVAYEPWLAVAPTAANYVNSVVVQNRTFNPALSAYPTITAGAAASGVWTVRIMNSTNTVIRTYTGSGASTSITWDGKDDNGTLQTAARYAYTADTTAGGDAAATARGALILTSANYLPATTLTLTQNQVLSNVYQNGSANVPIIGTAADPNLNNWILDYGAGTAPSAWTTLSTGTTNIQNQQFVILPTLPLTNGPYVVRLRAWDKDGMYTETPISVSVQNFKVSQNASQLNATSGTITYTSIVPFTLTETLVIKNSTGTVVRNLVNASRTANTYNDPWTARNDTNQYVPDDGYFYVATVTDGTHTMTWDLAAGYTPIQREVTHATISGFFDPFNNQPLTISYNWPGARRTYVAVSNNPAEISCAPPYYCISEGTWDEAGPHSVQWVGVDSTGAFRANTKTSNYIARVSYDFAPNGVVVFGTKPTITTLRATPPVFSPAFGSPTVISFTLGTFQSSTANVTLKFINQGSVSTLRSITLPTQAAGAVSVTWDGLADNGMKVAPGTYTVEVSVTDPIGNVVKGRVLATIQY